jgi:hypothetical protein
VIELLVGTLLTSILLALLVRDFGFTSRTTEEMEQLMETQQGVRAALSAVTQELRQAGACLPRTGDIIALNGGDDGEQDSLAVRIGKVTDNLVCIRTVLLATAEEGDSVLSVQDTTGFALGDWIYVRNASGSGDAFTVAGVSSGLLTLDRAVEEELAVGTGVFAVEERRYAVNSSGTSPVLTVSVDGGDPHPLVNNVEVFNVRYVTIPCPPCDEIDVPADSDEWALVREVVVSITVRSSRPNRAGEYVRLSDETNIKPRNLL